MKLIPRIDLQALANKLVSICYFFLECCNFVFHSNSLNTTYTFVNFILQRNHRGYSLCSNNEAAKVDSFLCPNISSLG